MPYIGKKPADIIATVIDTTTGTFSGEVDAGSLDVSGNADIDGTTNLDNTDIDGTLDVSGNLTVDTNTLHVDSANNKVGIGTVSPNSSWVSASNLVISDTSSDGGMTILSGTSGNGNIMFSDTTGGAFSDARGLITYLHASDAMRFHTANTEAMRIDSSGNVGIGTSSPASALHIDAADSAAGGFRMKNTAGESVELYYASGSADADFIINRTGSGAADIGLKHTGDVYFTSGNVGIGTSSPSNPLEVIGSEDANIATFSTLGDGGGASNRGLSIAADSYGGSIRTVGSSVSMGFDVNASERMRIDSSGNVGIGTSSPSSTLAVETGGIASLSSYAGHIVVGPSSRTSSSGDYSGGILFDQANGVQVSGKKGASIVGFQDGSDVNSMGLTFNVHGTDGSANREEAMRIDSSGNVGIGTSSPAQLLHVQAGGSGNGTIRLGGNAGLEISHDNAGNTLQRIDSLYRTTANDTNLQLRTGTLTFHTGTSSTERMRIDSSGHVGILTSSPSTYLEIARDGQAGAISGTYHKDTFASMLITGNETRLQIASTDGGSDAAMLLLSSGRNNWAVRANAPDAGNRFAIGYNFSSSDGNIGGYSGLTKGIEIETNGAVTMPNQPAFLVRPTSFITNIAVGSEVTIAMGTEIFDQNSDYDNTTFTFTAPVTGKYRFDYAIRLQNVDTASSYYLSRLSTSNRSYDIIVDTDEYNSDLEYLAFSNSVLADMDAGDTAKLRIYQNQGTSQTDINENNTRFSGNLVC